MKTNFSGLNFDGRDEGVVFECVRLQAGDVFSSQTDRYNNLWDAEVTVEAVWYSIDFHTKEVCQWVDLVCPEDLENWNTEGAV